MMELEVAKSIEHLGLPLQHKRGMIAMLTEKCPVAVSREGLGVSRSSYYYQLVESLDEAKLKEAIERTAMGALPRSCDVGERW